MKNFSIFSFIFLFLLSVLSLSPSTIFAEDNDESFSKVMTYEQYLEFKDLGFIDEDLTFDEVKEYQIRTLELEKQLENSSDFTLMKGRSITLQPGDVLITNATSAFGLTGHSAIALSSDQILHIPGLNESVTVDSKRTFESDYGDGWITVYRPNDYKNGSKAAGWAERNYKNSSAKYVLTGDFESIDKTYCSKIVLQSYYYGCGVTREKPKGLLSPYDVSRIINNDFRISIGREGDL